MAAAVILTPTVDPSAIGSILTFVTPAAQGCGMACGYCFIDRRGEETRIETLQPHDYARFIHEAAKLQRVAAVTIQGREPLAPSSRPWTEAILEAGAAVGAETGIVTNGFWLEDCVPLLAEQKCSGVAVSIDADSPEEHDHLRQTPGAWQRAMDGLRALTDCGAVARVTVSSVFFNKNSVRKLMNLPQHLANAGVTCWSISPMFRFDGQRRPTVAISNAEWSEALSMLSAHAARFGISVIAENEFSTFEGVQAPSVTLRTMSRPQGIMRMGPDGRCSFGKDILAAVAPNENEPFWRPENDVSDIVDRLNH